MKACERPSGLGGEEQNQYPKSAQPLFRRHYAVPQSPSWAKPTMPIGCIPCPPGKHPLIVQQESTLFCPSLCKIFDKWFFSSLFFYMMKKFCFQTCFSMCFRHIVHQEIEMPDVSLVLQNLMLRWETLTQTFQTRSQHWKHMRCGSLHHYLALDSFWYIS